MAVVDCKDNYDLYVVGETTYYLNQGHNLEFVFNTIPGENPQIHWERLPGIPFDSIRMNIENQYLTVLNKSKTKYL